MTTSPDRREYYRQRYLRNRERILEKQKAYGKQPEIRARRLKYWHERYKARIASDPALQAKRRRQQLDSYYLRHYGTTTPEPGAQSVIDGRRYLGPKELRPPKPCPAPRHPRPTTSNTSNTTRSTTATASRTTTAAPAVPPSKPTATSSKPSTTASMSGTTPASTPTTPPKPPWIPTPVSHWEPGLARQAEREFYL